LKKDGVDLIVSSTIDCSVVELAGVAVVLASVSLLTLFNLKIRAGLTIRYFPLKINEPDLVNDMQNIFVLQLFHCLYRPDDDLTIVVP
jgi:hypothetical protein